MQISNTSANLYLECPEKYRLHYKEKIRPLTKNASLYFGTSIDKAITEYLKDPTVDYKKIFMDKWEYDFDNHRKKLQLYDSVFINYSYNDFDEELLTSEDLVEAERSKKELLPTFEGSYLEAYEHVSNRKRQRAHIYFPDNELRYFNRLSWLSLRRKGLYMIESFMTEIYPKVKAVLTTQKRVSVKNMSGDTLVGYADMILDYDDKGPVVFDLKTAALEYDELQAKISQQLGLYSALLGEEFQTKKVGFIVLLKSLKKERIKICKVCGHNGKGSHKTCDATNSSGKRCNGEWNQTLTVKGRTQVLIDELTHNQIDSVINTMSSLVGVIKQDVFYKNTNSCLNYDGCPYFNLCHKQSMEGLEKIEKDDE